MSLILRKFIGGYVNLSLRDGSKLGPLTLVDVDEHGLLAQDGGGGMRYVSHAGYQQVVPTSQSSPTFSTQQMQATAAMMGVPYGLAMNYTPPAQTPSMSPAQIQQLVTQQVDQLRAQMAPATSAPTPQPQYLLQTPQPPAAPQYAPPAAPPQYAPPAPPPPQYALQPTAPDRNGIARTYLQSARGLAQANQPQAAMAQLNVAQGFAEDAGLRQEIAALHAQLSPQPPPPPPQPPAAPPQAAPQPPAAPPQAAPQAPPAAPPAAVPAQVPPGRA